VLFRLATAASCWEAAPWTNPAGAAWTRERTCIRCSEHKAQLNIEWGGGARGQVRVGRRRRTDHRHLALAMQCSPLCRWPYVCALGRASRSVDTVTYEEQACGASLIHPQVALTGEEGGLKGRSEAPSRRHLFETCQALRPPPSPLVQLPTAPPQTRATPGRAWRCCATRQSWGAQRWRGPLACLLAPDARLWPARHAGRSATARCFAA
jgi:hypothetical protein